MSNERIARFERVLVAIAARKPASVPMTAEDEKRAAWVVDAVSRFEERQKVAPGIEPPTRQPRAAVKRSVAQPGEQSPAPRRPRRRRKARAPVAQGRRPGRPGRPRKIQPPSEDTGG